MQCLITPMGEHFVPDSRWELKRLHNFAAGLRTRCQWLHKKSTYGAHCGNKHPGSPGPPTSRPHHPLCSVIAFSPSDYIANLPGCVWNVMIAKAFSALLSVSRLCVLLLSGVTLSLFTLYLVWQYFEIYWVWNLINITIFSFNCMPHSNSSLKGTFQARPFPWYWHNLLYIM